MKYTEITTKLSKNRHNWDEKTINILTRYFHELSLTINKFINVEELMTRFIESDNLKNGIIYLGNEIIHNKYDAIYSLKEKCIKLTKINENNDYINYILFHELTHAVSCHENNIAFLNYEGLNEGITELITILRNNKIGYHFDNRGIYNIITSLSYLLGNIIGYSNLFSAYFYDANKLRKLINNKRMNYNEIVTCLDYFIDKENLFIQMDFNEEFINYTRIIVFNFFDSFGEIDNLEKFEAKIAFISLYIKMPFSLNYTDEYSTYMEIIINKQTLLELNYEEKEVDDILKKYELYDKDKFEKYIEKNKTENITNDEEI